MTAVREREDRGVGTQRNILTASPLIWVLLVAALGWAIWATVGGSSKSAVQGGRAVMIATGAKARTVVALPCLPSSGGGGGGSSGGSSGAKAPDSVSLPAHSGTRVVIVPGCGGSSGGSGASGLVGRALIVLPSGSSVPKSGGVKSVFQAPASSDASVVVVPRCAGSKGGGSKQPAPLPPAGAGVVVAPPCKSGG